eukprot:CAMPEP_0169471348 /NCGR_PEP_ID=MMETSP1042-20121227/24548_1 /TAXON_ID=464988 /ORGANISM="Hemiselmis andersenii, Strain CCMP1180" /LENGTH=229 /DNA_ID=CAMNT_0009585051 /DNA_START=16 /DNA_END=701 /DNA_ORIENTATION=-
MAERRPLTDEERDLEEAHRHFGDNIFDDLFRMCPAFRLDAFPPGCLTVSGALAFASGMLFLLAAFLNVVLPHYERVQYSVQTRCHIVSIDDDPLIDDRLVHMKVKFPLPGIPGLMDGDVLCYGTQRCSKYKPDSIQDCYFDTQDHTLRFYTTMSGTHSIRLLSYLILGVPLLIAAACCLGPASQHWRWQLRMMTLEAREALWKVRLDGTDAKARWEERQRAEEMGYGTG